MNTKTTQTQKIQSMVQNPEINNRSTLSDNGVMPIRFRFCRPRHRVNTSTVEYPM